MGILPVCMYVHQVHDWCPWRQEEGVDYPRTGVTDDCEPKCVSWELNMGLFNCQAVSSALHV